MIYLASPYSSPDPEVVKQRVVETEQALACLLIRRENVWSPIVHCHSVATQYDMPTDAAFWKGYNEDFIRRADSVYVLQLQGWEQSKGVTMEIEFAKLLGLPLFYITPDNGYAKSENPWFFTKHTEIMTAEEIRQYDEEQDYLAEKAALLGPELVERAFQATVECMYGDSELKEPPKDRMSLTLSDLRIPRSQ